MDIKQDLNSLGKSRTDKMLGGVCGGFAESTGTPAWIWRVGFVLVALGLGTGLLAYILLWIFMPFRNGSH